MKKIIELLDKRIKVVIAAVVVINVAAVWILLTPFGDSSEIDAVIIDLPAENAALGAARTDLNGNGILEQTTMGHGYTSGVFSFVISVLEGEEDCSRMFVSGRHSSAPSFVVKDGELYVRFVSPAGEVEKDYLLVFEEGELDLVDENGESFS